LALAGLGCWDSTPPAPQPVPPAVAPPAEPAVPAQPEPGGEQPPAETDPVEPEEADAPADAASLTILYTNDMHAHFESKKGKEGPSGGILAIDAQVRQVREKRPNVLLLDAGDCISGHPITYELHQGVQGGLMQMVNHGLSTGALFLLVGMLYERRHTRLIADFGGLAKQVPVFTTFFMIITLSSIGLPGLNGFVGEFLVLLGTFLTNKVYAALAASGVIFAAVYMLWMFERVMFGKITNEENSRLRDLSPREITVLVPVVVFVVMIGVWADPFLKKMETSVDYLLSSVKQRAEIAQQIERGEIQRPAGIAAMSREGAK
jgi:hypothetical protein